MAFTGTATHQLLGLFVDRITGLSLGASATGIICLNGDATAPAGSTQIPSQYIVTDANQGTGSALGWVLTGNSGGAGTLDSPTLIDLIEVTVNYTSGLSAGYVAVSKSFVGGHLQIALSERAALATGNLEIYVKFHPALTR